MLVTTQLWWDGGGGQETSKIPSRARLLSMPAPCEFPPVLGIPALERSYSANGEFNDAIIVSNSADRHVNRLAHTLEVDAGRRIWQTYVINEERSPLWMWVGQRGIRAVPQSLEGRLLFSRNNREMTGLCRSWN